MKRKIVMYMENLYNMNVFKRIIYVWVIFQGILWITFGVAYFTHTDAWINVVEVNPSSAAVGGWLTTFLYIFLNNMIIVALISFGNIFVCFGTITPGTLVLLVQAISIGWIAGTNGFQVPFESVAAANIQYLKIGLWETTAYAVACAVTLPKSMNIADRFPAKKWSQERKFKDIGYSTSELIALLFGVVILAVGAIVETFAIKL